MSRLRCSEGVVGRDGRRRRERLYRAILLPRPQEEETGRNAARETW